MSILSPSKQVCQSWSLRSIKTGFAIAQAVVPKLSLLPRDAKAADLPGANFYIRGRVVRMSKIALCIWPRSPGGRRSAWDGLILWPARL